MPYNKENKGSSQNNIHGKKAFLNRYFTFLAHFSGTTDNLVYF